MTHTDGVCIRTVITAARDSRGLFMSAGFPCPKSLVRWSNREVLAHAISAYSVDLAETTVAINASEESEWGISTMIHSQFPEVRVVPVVDEVRGALATAMLALKSIDDQPLIVAGGDSRIRGGISHLVRGFVDQKLDAATIAFQSQNPRWSYLAVDETGAIQQVGEKQVIGPYASTGVFFFSSSRLFAEAATWVLVNNATHQGEFYVSATMNYLISCGRPTGFATIEPSEYQTWALPADFAVGT